MIRCMPAELAAPELRRQLGQLGNEPQALGERKRVIDRIQPQDEDLRQPAPIAEPPRDGDRLM
jgi:hypothetical protein